MNAPPRSTLSKIRMLPVLLAAVTGLPFWLAAENLVRNASFETVTRDAPFSTYNRAIPARDPGLLNRLDWGAARIEADPLAALAGLGELDAETGKGWRFVQEKGHAYEGQIALRCNVRDEFPIGLELEGGTYTFSCYASAPERDVLILRVQDIRGHKGEIRNDQKKAFTLGPDWTRCVFTASIESGPVTLSLESTGDGTLWVDALQIEAGPAATPFALHPWDQTPPRDCAGHERPLRPSGRQGVLTSNYVDRALDGITATSPESLRQPGSNGTIAVHVAVPPDTADYPCPASGGIPLPRGHLFDEQRLKALDAGGAEVPCQTRVLSRNVLDGSIQALLVDLLAPDSNAVFTLVYGPDVARAAFPSPLAVAQNGDRISAATGPLRFETGAAQFQFLDALWWDGNGDGAFTDDEQIITPRPEQGLWTRDTAGRAYWSGLGPIDYVRLEESGPIRACIAASGRHQSPEGQVLFRYITRIHAYAGKPYLRVEHVISNEQHPYATAFAGAGLRLGLKAGAFHRIAFSPTLARTVEAPDDAAYLVSKLGLREWKGAVSLPIQKADGDGMATVSGDRAAVTALIREWSWMPYKEFFFSPATGFDLCIWPRHLTRAFALPKGVARTHRFWLLFHPPNLAAAERTRWRDQFMEDARVEAEPAVYCDSTLFGQLAPRDPARFPEFENFLTRAGDGRFGRFPRPGEYGWFDFITYGDDRGDMGWGNMETMLDHCMWLHYVRSRDPWFYRRATDATLHYRDVDMCHPWGQPRVHSHNHTLLPWDGSHDWIKGILDHYLLTGDNRSLECAHEQGRWIRSIPLPYEIARGTRRWSRLIQNLADLYRVTGHPEYLENFQARIDTAIAMRGSETNISLFQLDLLKEQPVMPSYGRLGFQHYYGINGVLEVAAATEDPHWKQLFLDEVRFLVGDGARRVPYQTDEEFAAWGRSKGKSASSGRDRLFYPLLAYAHRLTGERKWAEAAIGSAFFETTRSDWKDDYPNLGYADQVWAAYGIAFARLVGMGPEDEQEARQEGVTKGIPTALGDPKFEGATPGAWASGKDVYTAKLFNFMEIAMDDQVRLQGARALVVRETRDIGITKDLDRSKRLLPLTMSRNLILMEKPGFYRLSGFVRFEKHGRPDLALELDTLADDSRVRHDLNLPALLPAIRYANMIVGEEARSEISAASMLQAKQGNADEDVTPLLGDLTAEEDPESRWWRFSFPFEVRAPSTLRLILMYRYGLRPPGTVWFDDFSLEPIPAPPADALRCDVQKGPPVGP